MSGLNRFLKHVSALDLSLHLHRLDPEMLMSFDDGPANELIGYVETLPQNFRDQLQIDCERVAAMVDEVGQAALLALNLLRDRLNPIEGAHARAYYAFLHEPDLFRQAEEVRFADENHNARRMWDGFVGPIGVEVQSEGEHLDQFAARLSGVLDLGQVHVERIERQRLRDAESQDLIQLTIYSEDVPEDELVFATPGPVQHRAHKPVRETAIVYEPATGTIEVVGRRRTSREDVACVFAETLLGVELSGDRLPQRCFDLLCLLDPHSFPCGPDDGIARVKLTRLALSTYDGRLVQILQVPFREAATMHEILTEHYGDDSPLDSGQLRPWSARVEVEFEPEDGRKRGKKINIDINTPNRCSLRGKNAKERLLLERHLKAWGLRVDEAT